MNTGMRQDLVQRQKLMLTPQLRQAIRLLALPRAEVEEEVSEEKAENPLLEESGETEEEDRKDSGFAWENYDAYATARPIPSSSRNVEDLPSLESSLTKPQSLLDHLVEQLKLCRMNKVDQRVAMLILGNVDAEGRLDDPLTHIAKEAGVPVVQAERVLRRLQDLDPPGVCARSTAECLLIQARRAGVDDDVVVKLIQDHRATLARKNYQAIARHLGVTIERVHEAVRIILELDPRPCRQYASEQPRYITPDVFIHKVDDEFVVTSNDSGMPRLKVSTHYRELLRRGGKERRFVKEKLDAARRLIDAINQRQRTILAVTRSIVKFQGEFLERGPGHLKPLILQDVADDTGFHESTVSRVTTEKYASTPYGIYELKYFFNPGIPTSGSQDVASEAVRSGIKELITHEDPRHPHSDQTIVKMFAERGIKVARRTVAKYREQLGVLPAAGRRQVL